MKLKVVMSGMELGQHGTSKAGKEWQMYKYSFLTEDNKRMFATGFKKYPIEMGDLVELEYNEIPNPNGKYPYRNIVDMVKCSKEEQATIKQVVVQQPNPVIDTQEPKLADRIKEIVELYREQVKPSDWDAMKFRGIVYRNLYPEKNDTLKELCPTTMDINEFTGKMYDLMQTEKSKLLLQLYIKEFIC